MNALQGKNLAKIKQQNMENIKTILYRSAPLSRAQIANQLELTPPTITNIVGELIQQGVVQELEKTEGEGRGAGRKPINIDLVPGAHLSLGVSLGRDATHYCITDLRGKVLAQGTADLMPEGAAAGGGHSPARHRGRPQRRYQESRLQRTAGVAREAAGQPGQPKDRASGSA